MSWKFLIKDKIIHHHLMEGKVKLQISQKTIIAHKIDTSDRAETFPYGMRKTYGANSSRGGVAAGKYSVCSKLLVDRYFLIIAKNHFNLFIQFF